MMDRALKSMNAVFAVDKAFHRKTAIAMETLLMCWESVGDFAQLTMTTMGSVMTKRSTGARILKQQTFYPRLRVMTVAVCSRKEAILHAISNTTVMVTEALVQAHLLGSIQAEHTQLTCQLQSYDYATVQIFEQCWFAENLRAENYRNGDELSTNLDNSQWGSSTIGAVAVYGEGGGPCESYSPDGYACDESWSLNEYGRLYNWYALEDARGLCPSGWHVPSDADWTVMTDNLGGELIAGGEMKSGYGWLDGGNGTNSSGFTGLPGGARFASGIEYYSAGRLGYWWTSSIDSN